MDYKDENQINPLKNEEETGINKSKVLSITDLISKTNFLIESLESSPKVSKTLREIIKTLKLLDGQNYSEFIHNQFFMQLLCSYIQEKTTAIYALEIIFLFLKNNEECIKVLFDNNIVQIFVNQLVQQNDTNITCLICKCLGKCLKAFKTYGFDFTINQELLFSLFSYASHVNESFQKDYSKIIFILLKYYDCSEFLDYIIAQALIILEHRKSNDSIKYVILQMKEILTRYPERINDFMEYSLVDIILESKIVDNNFDSIAILNIIQAFVELDNEEITQKIKEKLQLDELQKALQLNNEAVVYNALLLFEQCLNHDLLSMDWIDENNVIDTIVHLLDTGLIESKVKAISILLSDSLLPKLSVPQKDKFVETGVDIIQELKGITSNFILALYNFVVHGGPDAQHFLDLYQELDIKDIFENNEFDEESSNAIEQFMHLFDEE